MENPVTKFGITAQNFEKKFDAVYQYAYEYYCNSGEMPYGTMKARTGDPYQWIFDRIMQEVEPI